MTTAWSPCWCQRKTWLVACSLCGRGGRLAPRMGEWRFSGTHTSTPRRCGTGTQCDGASLECRTTAQSWNLNTESRSSKCPSPFSSYTSHEHQRRTILAEGLAYCFVHRGRRWLGAVPAAVAVIARRVQLFVAGGCLGYVCFLVVLAMIDGLRNA